MTNLIVVSIIIAIYLNGMPAFAKWGTFSMTDEHDDQVTVKHGLFGKKTIVKDRYGNGFKHSKSIFGLTKDTQVGVLGNEMHVHKGLFGFGKTEGHDIFGDTVTSKKNLLYRNTNIDLSGVDDFLSKKFAAKPALPQPSSNPPGQELVPNVPPNPTTPLK